MSTPSVPLPLGSLLSDCVVLGAETDTVKSIDAFSDGAPGAGRYISRASVPWCVIPPAYSCQICKAFVSAASGLVGNRTSDTPRRRPFTDWYLDRVAHRITGKGSQAAHRPRHTAQGRG